MEQGWLTAIAKAAFLIAGLILTRRWLERSRKRPRPPEQARQLAYPTAMLVLAVLGVLFFCGVTIAAMIWPDERHPVLAAVMLGGFILLPGALLADYFFARHTVTDDGMEFGRMSGKRGAFRWAEVKRVYFGHMGHWFKLELQSGEIVRISAFQMGLPAFADCVLRHVPSARIDKATYSLLEQTARGTLPRLG